MQDEGAEKEMTTDLPGGGVRVAVLAGDCFFIPAGYNDPISSIKAQIHQKVGHDISSQRLIFEGEELDDLQTLGSLVIGSAVNPSVVTPAVLHLLVRQNSVQVAGAKISDPCKLPWGVEGVCVKTLTGKESAIPAKQLDTVLNVKERLCGKWCIPPAHQKLLFDGEEMDDCNTLQSYGISTATCSTVYVLVHTPDIDEHLPFASLGSILERRLDGMWFAARVLHCHAAQEGQPTHVDLQYTDDGKDENMVDLKECRPCEKRNLPN